MICNEQIPNLLKRQHCIRNHLQSFSFLSFSALLQSFWSPRSEMTKECKSDQSQDKPSAVPEVAAAVDMLSAFLSAFGAEDGADAGSGQWTCQKGQSNMSFNQNTAKTWKKLKHPSWFGFVGISAICQTRWPSALLLPPQPIANFTLQTMQSKLVHALMFDTSAVGFTLLSWMLQEIKHLMRRLKI